MMFVSISLASRASSDQLLSFPSKRAWRAASSGKERCTSETNSEADERPLPKSNDASQGDYGQ